MWMPVSKTADDVSGYWDATPAIGSANLLVGVFWSLDSRLWVFSSIGKVAFPDICFIMFCGCVSSRCAGTCPERNSGVCCEAFCPVTMWWAYVWKSLFFSLSKKSPSYTVILPRVSSILFISVCEFILQKDFIRRPSKIRKKMPLIRFQYVIVNTPFWMRIGRLHSQFHSRFYWIFYCSRYLVLESSFYWCHHIIHFTPNFTNKFFFQICAHLLLGNIFFSCVDCSVWRSSST